MEKRKLLPHSWQLTGFGLFVVFAIWLVISVLKQKGLVPPMTGDYGIQMILWRLAIPVACCIMAFSQERVEDEWISSVRYRSLLVSLIIWFSISILISTVSSCLSTFKLASFDSIGKFNLYCNLLSGINCFPLLYMIVLKASLWNQKRKLSKDDGACEMQIRQPFMLPHSWQIRGFVAGVICYACAVIARTMIALTLYDSSVAVGMMLLAGYLISPIALTASALSKEKTEDERITGIRRTALFRTTVFYLTVMVISIIATFFIIQMTCPEVYARISVIIHCFFGWSPFMIYYFVIYKISLHNENKALDNEE